MPSAPACCACWLQFNGFPGVGAAGADQDRHATIDVIDSKAGNCLRSSAPSWENSPPLPEEQAVNACFDEIVDQRGSARLIELAVGGKRWWGDRGMIPVNNADFGMRSLLESFCSIL